MNRAVTVAAAMIVRDEERYLGACLDSLVGCVDEIVIVDTGSTDNTIEIAKRAGAQVIYYTWTQDFSAARNIALDSVKSDWVLYIDADERLRMPHRGNLSALIDSSAVAAYVCFRPKTGYTRYRELRLFRNDPRIRFRGRIHETVWPSIAEIGNREGLPIIRTPVEIDHVGYDVDQPQKNIRNLSLLESAVLDDPGRVYYWYHLSETLAALGRMQDAEEAAREGLVRALQDPSPKQRADASMIIQTLVRLQLDRGEDPIALIKAGLARVPEDYALLFMHGRALLDAARPREALEIANRLRAVDPDTLRDGLLAFDAALFRQKASEMAAIASLRLGRRSDAAAHFFEAAGYAPEEPAYRLKAAALASSGNALDKL